MSLLVRAWIIVAALAVAAAGEATALDVRPEAVAAGRSVFQGICETCHGMKYLGISPRMPPDVARKAFGREPPDLSLMAAARGRGRGGADYVVRLLTGYNGSPQKNSVFPGIAMPPPIPADDPELEEKARHVAAFLYEASFPNFRIRQSTGRYVIAFTVVLAGLLYALYRSVRRGLHS